MRAMILAMTLLLALAPAGALATGEVGETVCGGLTGATCGEGEYCHYPPEARCGIADQTGVCRQRPQVCTREYQPVCGCDGQTYGNDCDAAAAGTSPAHPGECGTEPPAQ